MKSMARIKNLALFMMGAASAAGLAYAIRRRRGETGDLGAWKKVLIRRHGSERAGQLVSAIRQRQAALVAENSKPENPLLRWHLRSNILPGLALYQVLLGEHGGDKRAALGEVDEALRASTLIKNSFLLAPLKVAPEPFRLFKLVYPLMMKTYPAEGWDFDYVENNDTVVAFNATRCFYLKALTANGAPELTASFCKTDDVMAELFPPSIRFVRPHTLGRGDAVCDFQYCRVEHPDVQFAFWCPH